MTTDLFGQTRRSAIFSPDRLHRYELRIVWDDTLPPYVSGMLNPSTADEVRNDPTIERNERRARRLGYGSLIVWNLGAGRATDPADWMAMADPIGPENDAHIRRILTECRDRAGAAVVGWGVLGTFRRRDRAAIAIAQAVGVPLKCLGVTLSGHPRHPLYVSYEAPLIDWTPREEPCHPPS